MLPGTTLLLSRADVGAALDLDTCIDAVEDAFRAYGHGRCRTGVLGAHVEGGGFHVKTAALEGDTPLFVTKINGNFHENGARFGLPRIQGMIVLCDARHGYPLAVMDSTLITQLRTAAATAVAARPLARNDASVVTIAGCGVQGRAQLRAIAAVRRIARVFAWDRDAAVAEAFARDLAPLVGCDVRVATALRDAAVASDIVITCTPATSAILHAGDVRPGTFIAAVGADSEAKQEIAPDLMAASAVVPDVLDQAATIGDLHHAIAAGVMRREDARAELGAIVAGRADGRRHDDEIIVFDSTGSALQDVAAAAVAWRGAMRLGLGTALALV